MLTFWLTVIAPIIIGTSAIAAMNLLKRRVLNPKSGIDVSPLQFLIAGFGISVGILSPVYLYLYRLSLPKVLPGFWRTIRLGAFINVFIQFSNAKAASFAKGDASLTAPLQAMTPGMITLLGLALGEWPSRIGVLGVLVMASGSYILLWDKMPQRWYEWFGPLKRLLSLTRLNSLDEEERDKTLAVSFAFLSACLGTFGLLFDGLYTRRSGGTMQGYMLSFISWTALIAAGLSVWYIVKPDAKTTSLRQLVQILFRGLPETNGKEAAQKTLLNFFWQHRVALFFVAFGLAWIAHMYFIWPAFNTTYVAYVGTLKRFQILITVVLGHFLFGEGEFKKRLVAAVVIIIGALLISTDDLPSRIATKIEGLGI